ncbi:uncharacterized protein [Ptychodera flava]|uniref:uncharacterized protein n=1 Tax=Ptychodera flava TaxID=63121 RepID=UPI003969F2D4
MGLIESHTPKDLGSDFSHELGIFCLTRAAVSFFTDDKEDLGTKEAEFGNMLAEAGPSTDEPQNTAPSSESLKRTSDETTRCKTKTGSKRSCSDTTSSSRQKKSRSAKDTFRIEANGDPGQSSDEPFIVPTCNTNVPVSL